MPDPSTIVALILLGIGVYIVVVSALARLERRSDRKTREMWEKAERDREAERLARESQEWEGDSDFWKKGKPTPWDKRDSDNDPINEPSPVE